MSFRQTFIEWCLIFRFAICTVWMSSYSNDESYLLKLRHLHDASCIMWEISEEIQLQRYLTVFWLLCEVESRMFAVSSPVFHLHALDEQLLKPGFVCGCHRVCCQTRFSALLYIIFIHCLIYCVKMSKSVQCSDILCRMSSEFWQLLSFM